MSTLDDVTSNLRALLLSSKGGVPVSRIEREYADTFGPFQPSSIGFSSLYDVLRSNPDNFIFYGNCVLATVKSSSAHIADLVSQQKTSKKSRRSEKFHRAFELLRDHRGHTRHMRHKTERSRSEKIHSSHDVMNFEYKGFDKINPYSIWKIAVRVFTKTPSRFNRKTYTNNKNIDPYEVRSIVHKIARKKNYNQGPLKYVRSDHKHHRSHESHESRERRNVYKPYPYNPNGWKYVSNALKECGAINSKNRERRKDKHYRHKSKKRDFSDDSIDEVA